MPRIFRAIWRESGRLMIFKNILRQIFVMSRKDSDDVTRLRSGYVVNMSKKYGTENALI